MTDAHDAPAGAYRASIDNIDAALVHLLAERFKITQAVGRYKAEVGLPPADPEREQQQVARLRALAEESGLDPAFTEKFLRFIVDEVILHHKRIAGGRAERRGASLGRGDDRRPGRARRRRGCRPRPAVSVGPSSTMNDTPSTVLRCHVAATPVYVPPVMRRIGSPVSSA